MNIVRKLYDWTLIKAGHQKATWFLALIAFTESSFFPIPPDVILIPMIIAKQVKAWVYAFICTISSVIGGVAGYCIGYFFFTSIGALIVEYYALSDQFNGFELYYNQYGMWIVLGAGFTPFPFKFITIASGLFHLNIFLFIGVAIIARGLRFFLLAFLLTIFGETIKNLIDKYFNTLATIFFILLVGSIVLLKLLQ